MNRGEGEVIGVGMGSSHCAEMEDVGAAIKTMKIGIGAIDHHTLQVESPEEVATIIRRALKVIPAERLVLSSDCGMGREGMSRRHATGPAVRDRKSTRLNSSHQIISYAVFCLKKKTTHQHCGVVLVTRYRSRWGLGPAQIRVGHHPELCLSPCFRARVKRLEHVTGRSLALAKS